MQAPKHEQYVYNTASQLLNERGADSAALMQVAPAQSQDMSAPPDSDQVMSEIDANAFDTMDMDTAPAAS